MHIYTKNGKEYPSVTTVLNCLGGENLLRWANNLGFKHRSYDGFMKSAADFGTLVHAHLRREVDPDAEFDLDAEIYPARIAECIEIVKRFRLFLQKNFKSYKTIATEKTMISEKLGYAGTCDWLLKIENKTILIDFKTSKRVKLNHLLQLGGYFNLLEDEGIHVDGVAIMICNLDYGMHLAAWDRNDATKFGMIFNHLWQYYYETQELGVAPNKEFQAKLTKR